MAWTYYAYLFSNIGIAAAILLIIGGILIFLIYKFDNIFYKIIKLMFHIELKYPDEEEKDTSVQKTDKVTAVFKVKEAFVQPQQSPTTRTTSLAVNDSMPNTSSEKKQLNLYGKVIDAKKKRNKIMLTVIIVAVIGSVCIAGVQGCLLANITVYPNGPCPSYGLMDCYGKNDTYFICTPSNQTDPTLFTDSATCFRWIGRDTTINDVMTQLGVCAGLFNAFCAVVQLVLRFLLYAWSKHPQTASEAKEEAEAEAKAAVVTPVIIVQSANGKEDIENNKKPKYTYEHPPMSSKSAKNRRLIAIYRNDNRALNRD